MPPEAEATGDTTEEREEKKTESPPSREREISFVHRHVTAHCCSGSTFAHRAGGLPTPLS
jgi:hypothetical protein